MARITKAEREESLSFLREEVKAGDTVYCILRSASRSGMSRKIAFLTIRGQDRVRVLAYHMARAMGYKYNSDDSLTVSGCGMDMGFHMVYNLGRVLFPDGFGVEMRKEGAKLDTAIVPTSREQAAELYAQGFRAFGRNGDQSGWDTDGGYALKHRWL